MTTEADKPQIPKDILEVANFLLNVSVSELKLRQGVLNGKRADFFKGKHAVNALLRDPYQNKSGLPSVESRADGESLMTKLQSFGLFVQVKKESGSKTLKLDQQSPFNPENFYVWVYQPSSVYGTLIGVGVLLIVFAGVLFPLWPPMMRQGVYYLSLCLMGFLGFLLGLGVIRLILWLLLVITIGRGGWLFPNLFADVGFIESFIPLWEWDEKKSKKKD